MRNLDDWLAFENVIEEELFLTQDEIRHLNSDFNYKHYGQFYEKIEENQAANANPAGNSYDEILSENEALLPAEVEALRKQASLKPPEVQADIKSARARSPPKNVSTSGLELSVDESNLLHQMWKKVKVEESFY